FSTAMRPAVRKIGRGRSSGRARSGANRLVSTPRVHMPRLRKPRRDSSAASDGVDTMVIDAAAWKRRSAAEVHASGTAQRVEMRPGTRVVYEVVTAIPRWTQ